MSYAKAFDEMVSNIETAVKVSIDEQEMLSIAELEFVQGLDVACRWYRARKESLKGKEDEGKKD